MGKPLRPAGHLHTSWEELRPGVRRGATTQFGCQTRQLNSMAQFSISRIALDQKVEGSNPSSPAILCWPGGAAHSTVKKGYRGPSQMNTSTSGRVANAGLVA